MPRPILVLCLVASAAVSTHAAPDWPQVASALDATCLECHSTRKTKGGVNLEALLGNPQVETEFALWEKVRQVVEAGEMPPEDADELLPADKTALITWVNTSLNEVANRNAGDPGPVTLRRLTNFEYDNTLRDLTGVDLQLSKAFAPDGGGGEGFSNIGDVLFVSPQQLDKYLKAARRLADHATILPGTGIQFHPQRIGLRGPKQIKDQAQQALYIWYQKAASPHLPKDGDDFREADYMLACWKWKHKDQTGAQSLAQLARDAGLVLPFLENWWTLLHDTQLQSRFLDLTRLPWRNLPPPTQEITDIPVRPSPNGEAALFTIPPAVTQSLAAIQSQRRSWLGTKSPGSGVQRRQQDADGLRPYTMRTPIPKGQKTVHLVLGDLGDGNAGDLVHVSDLSLKLNNQTHAYVPFMRQRRDSLRQMLTDLASGKPHPNPETPADLKQRIADIEAALSHFGKDPLGKPIDPKTLAATAPTVITLPLPDGTTEVFATGKLDFDSPESDQATVQWTLTTGTPPDPKTILPGVLTIWKRQTDAARRTMGDFGRMKSAFPDVFERRLQEVADNLHRGGQPGIGVYYLNDTQLAALLPRHEKDRFRQMQEDWAFVSPAKLSGQQQADYHQRLRSHLHRFADHAWRRPTTSEEKTQLSKLYEAGLATPLAPENAAREVLVRILVSPHFLYKAETLRALSQSPEGTADTPVRPTQPAQPLTPPPVSSSPSLPTAPLDPYQLASRLSYFLWASAPDAPLRQAAADGSLRQPKVRQAQVLRMLKDPKAAALAKAFAGQWLEFAGFAEKTTMDAQKFPQFTPELRAAMNQETHLFFENLVRQDRPVRDILLADYTYLNEPLARHYQIPNVVGPEFRQVSVQGHPRGGLLGMGSVLAKTSRPHRTSPVLRGNWLLNAVLGTPVPPPPNAVPELQEHPEKPASLRAQLEQHREDPACASCHNRIDPLGFALERFDPIGRLREKDDLGQTIDSSASLTDGTTFDGFHGLRKYLATRESNFTRLFSRKLLGYALGRSVLPSDNALIETIQVRLQTSDTRFSAAALAIIESRQFQNRRVD